MPTRISGAVDSSAGGSIPQLRLEARTQNSLDPNWTQSRPALVARITGDYQRSLYPLGRGPLTWPHPEIMRAIADIDQPPRTERALVYLP